jgi:glycosyltransferase 2 family protein
MTDNSEQATESSDKRKSSLWFSVLSVILAVVLVTLAFRGVDWDELLNTAAGARINYLLVYCLVVCLATSLRGLRWWVLLRADGPISVGTVMLASMAGQFTNCFIPGRGGDLYRVLYLGKCANASKSFALATTLTERVMDVVALAAFGVVAMMWLENIPEWVVTGTRVVAVLGAIGVVVLLAIPLMEVPIHTVVGRLPLPSTLRERLKRMIPRFVQGLKALRQPIRALSFISLTIVTLLIDALATSLWAVALHLTLPFKHAILLNTVLNLSQAVPMTPGGLGVYQFLAVTVLMPFGFSRAQALGYIISSQMVVYVVMAILGCIALIRPYRDVRS